MKLKRGFSPGLRWAVGRSTQTPINSTVAGSNYTRISILCYTPENAAMAVTPGGWKDDDPAPPAGNWSIAGWYLYHFLQPTGTEVGFNGHQRMRAGPGSQNTGAFWSFGSTGSTERALGDVGSTTIGIIPTPATNDQSVLHACE